MISSISQSPLQSMASAIPSGGGIPLTESARVMKSQAADTAQLPAIKHQSVTPQDGREDQQSKSTSERVTNSETTVELSEEALKVISQLQARDAEVKTHEQAHLAAAGGYATGGISYVYQVGPDGRRYAIGGEVGIDTSAIAGDPEATLLKANIVQRAALAPAEPSAQDMRVASAAMQMAAQARMEIAQQSAQADEGQDETVDASKEAATSAREGANEGAKLFDSMGEGTDLQRVLPMAERQEFNLRVALQQIV